MIDTLKHKLTERNEQGFTIIEVVLVLAIAGLIFLVVFLAVPQLQRSQRDSQRQQDVNRFVTALESYSSNNNGRYPNAGNQTEVHAFRDAYIVTAGESQFTDPLEDDTYVISQLTTPIQANVTDFGDMYYNTGAVCSDTEGDIETSTNSRNFAVLVPLENGIAFCQDNR